MHYRISGLDPAPFTHLFGADEATLARHLARRVNVAGPGFPERCELRDLEPGETALLVNFEHLPVNTPYRACHALYVLEGATTARVCEDSVPPMLARRLLSVRAFDAQGMMVEADVCEGHALEPLIQRLLSRDGVAYLHVHTARQGCYLARVERSDRPE